MFSSWPVVALVEGVKMGSGKASDSFRPGGKRDAADLAGGLVFLPGGAGDVAAHHALDREHFGALHQHGASAQLVGILADRRRILVDLGRDQVVGDDIGEVIEPEQGNLGQDAALVGNAGGQNVVEGGDAVGGDEEQLLVAEAVHIAHLAAGMKVEIGEVSL